MAFNWKTFWTRAFTALLFVAIMAAGLLYSEWSFLLLIIGVYIGCWRELALLIEKIYKTTFHRYLVTGLAAMGVHVLLLFCKSMSIAGYNVRDSYSLPFLIAGIVLSIWGIFKQKKIEEKYLRSLFAGAFSMALSMGGLLHLRLSQRIEVLQSDTTLLGRPNGFYIPLLLIVAIWINDTMAYLVGSAIGKTPFSKISPKKTMEGTIGGAVLCILAMTFILQPWFHWQQLLGISLLVAVFGTLGDLLESKLKRMAGVKDSGSIMPGHGGFLDRFDSLLVAIPAVWLFLQLF